MYTGWRSAMKEKRHDEDPPSEAAAVVIGRQYKNWLSEFVAERGDPSVTERKVIEQLLYHLRSARAEEQEAILRGDNTRPFNRIGEIIEVLPATASVFRQ
jgi:hypothetical protein